MLLSASLRPHHLSRRFHLALVGVSLCSTFALPALTYAAHISNQAAGGNTVIQTGGDLSLDTVQTHSAQHINYGGGSHLNFASSAEVGTQIQTQGDLQLQAGGDITARAAQVDAKGDLKAQSGGSIAIAAGSASQSVDDRYYRKDSSFLSSSSRTLEDQVQHSTAQASSFGGNTVTLAAGQNIAVTGSQVISDSGTTYTNTHINAGDKVSIQSGANTSLKGAVVTAPQVQASVGGNLQIESLQDSSAYHSQQSNQGISLSIPIAGTGSASGSISAGKANIHSDYQSTTEQSAIRAGDGGFQISTTGNTTLIGGQITSTQKAIDDNKNSFATGGTLTTQDLHNTADYSAKAVGVQLGTSVNHTGQYQPSGTSVGLGKDSDSASSTTQAAISDIAGNKDARTGDSETGLANTFDAGKVQADINAQVQITQSFGQQASKAVGDYAQEQMQKAQALRAAGQEQEALAIEALWGETGSLRLAAHTVIGGLTGGSSGAAGAAVGSLTAPAVADALAQAGIDGALANTLTALASTAAGAAVGGTAGGGAALNEVANNYLTHYQIKEKDAKLAKARTAEERAAIEAEYAQLDREQKNFAENCLLQQECGSSVLEKLNIPSYDEIMQACTPPRYCSAEEQRGVQELRNIYATAQNAIYPDTTIEEFLVANKMFGVIADSVKLAAGKIVSYGLGDVAKAANSGRAISAEGQSFLQSAEVPFKGQSLTNAGRATTKHPEYFGFNSTEELRAFYRTDAQLNELASKNLNEILTNGARTSGAGGRYPNGWVTYTLSDGRAASWSASGEFIGFRGLQK